jgi:hypothetical protein
VTQDVIECFMYMISISSPTSDCAKIHGYWRNTSRYAFIHGCKSYLSKFALYEHITQHLIDYCLSNNVGLRGVDSILLRQAQKLDSIYQNVHGHSIHFFSNNQA